MSTPNSTNLSRSRRPMLLTLLCCLCVSTVQAQPFARVCAISDLAPVYTVSQNSDTGEYSFVSVDTNFTLPSSDVHKDDNNRSLTTVHRQLAWGRTDKTSHQGTQASQSTPSASAYNSIWEVRQCPCAQGVYCNYDLDACGVPVNYSQPVGCFAQSTKTTLLRNAWPLLMLWYSTILFFLLCTEKGRNARNFIWLKCCNPKHNERIVDRFLYTHGFISTNPFRQDSPSQTPINWLPVARRVEPREPTELALKTRIYKGPETQDAQEEDCTCTICFASLDVGDRVGKLRCHHTFHVDCLKEWLPKRNVCPLCLTSNAAVPRYADGEEGVHEVQSDITENDQDSPSPGTNHTLDEEGGGHVELATVEASAGVNSTQSSQIRPNPSFAQQLLGVARI